MQIKRINKGENVVMPLIAFEKGSGMAVLKSSKNGLLISLNAKETNGGLLFLFESQLNEVGYFSNTEKENEPVALFPEKIGDEEEQ